VCIYVLIVSPVGCDTLSYHTNINIEFLWFGLGKFQFSTPLVYHNGCIILYRVTMYIRYPIVSRCIYDTLSYYTNINIEFLWFGLGKFQFFTPLVYHDEYTINTLPCRGVYTIPYRVTVYIRYPIVSH
jgi:hypothetical protein